MALAEGQTGHLADHEEAVYTVVHGATAGTARPTLGSAGTAPTIVRWFGTVEPTNWTDNDLWTDNSNGDVWVRISGSAVRVNSGAYAPSKILGPRYGFFTGRYYPAMLGTRTASFGLTDDTEYGVFFPVGTTTTVDRIGINVTSAGSTGSVIRLGIKEVASDGLPGDLTLDAGTVDATSTGFKEITISQSLSPGGVWLVAVGQGTPTTDPQVTGGSAAGYGELGHPTGAQAATTRLSGASKTGVSGALSSGGSWTGINTNGPVVLLRSA